AGARWHHAPNLPPSLLLLLLLLLPLLQAVLQLKPCRGRDHLGGGDVTKQLLSAKPTPRAGRGRPPQWAGRSPSPQLMPVPLSEQRRRASCCKRGVVLLRQSTFGGSSLSSL
ncbi:unnamed protein product, partial [Ectocarpus sp. 12 AP-2014]